MQALLLIKEFVFYNIHFYLNANLFVINQRFNCIFYYQSYSRVLHIICKNRKSNMKYQKKETPHNHSQIIDFSYDL